MNKPTIKNMDRGGFSGSVITRDQRQVNFLVTTGEKTRTALLLCNGELVALREDEESDKPSFGQLLVEKFDFQQTYDFFWPDALITESHALIVDALDHVFTMIKKRVSERQSSKLLRGVSVEVVSAAEEECNCPACEGKRHAAGASPKKPNLH